MTSVSGPAACNSDASKMEWTSRDIARPVIILLMILLLLLLLLIIMIVTMVIIATTISRGLRPVREALGGGEAAAAAEHGQQVELRGPEPGYYHCYLSIYFR